jgi:heat shock protein HtpX
MVGTFAAVTALSTLILVAAFAYLRIEFFGFYGLFGFVIFFHIIQWLIGPMLVNVVYRVKDAPQSEYPDLHRAVERLAVASKVKKPKVKISEMDMPNAFAYGSPFSGPMVAVTQGLLNRLPEDEVEAVLAHEVGHLKHRDILVMLMIGILPALVYYVGHMLYLSSIFSGSGYGGRRGGNTGVILLIGILLMVTSFILNLFVFYMSRLREYYADSHAARTLPDGSRKLQRGLVRIMQASKRDRLVKPTATHSQFKMFFIADPESSLESQGNVERMIDEIKKQKPTVLADLFSTHPHPAKRLRHLDKFRYI